MILKGLMMWFCDAPCLKPSVSPRVPVTAAPQGRGRDYGLAAAGHGGFFTLSTPYPVKTRLFLSC